MTGEGGDADLALYDPTASDVDVDVPAATSGNDDSFETIDGRTLTGGDWYPMPFAFDGLTVYELGVYVSEISAGNVGNRSRADRSGKVQLIQGGSAK